MAPRNRDCYRLMYAVPSRYGINRVFTWTTAIPIWIVFRINRREKVEMYVGHATTRAAAREIARDDMRVRREADNDTYKESGSVAAPRLAAIKAATELSADGYEYNTGIIVASPADAPSITPEKPSRYVGRVPSKKWMAKHGRVPDYGLSFGGPDTEPTEGGLEAYLDVLTEHKAAINRHAVRLAELIKDHPLSLDDARKYERAYSDYRKHDDPFFEACTLIERRVAVADSGENPEAFIGKAREREQDNDMDED